MNLFLLLGGVSGFIAVATGAFAAHGLREKLPPELLATFETGARYQMYHALALVLVGLLAARAPSGLLAASGWLFAAGTVLFSGSLYLLAVTGARTLGAITPFGGLCFLAGWALLAASALRRGRAREALHKPAYCESRFSRCVGQPRRCASQLTASRLPMLAPRVPASLRPRLSRDAGLVQRFPREWRRSRCAGRGIASRPARCAGRSPSGARGSSARAPRPGCSGRRIR